MLNMRLGIRAKLIIMVTLPLLIVTIVFSSFFIIFMSKTMHNDLYSKGVTQAKSIAKDLAYPIIINDKKELELSAKNILNSGAIASIAIMNDQKNVLIQMHSEQYSTQNVIEINQVVMGDEFNVRSDEFDLFSLDQPTPKKLIAIGYINLKISRDNVTRLVKRITTTVIVFLLITTVIIVGLTIMVSRYATIPLNMLVKGTQKIAQGDLDVTIPITVDDEIGDLSKCFNKMTSTLRGTVDGLIGEIQQRKLAQDELNRTKSYLHNVVNSMPSLLIGIDAEGEIIDINYEAEKHSGIINKQAIGQPVDNLLPELKAYMDQILSSIKRKQAIEFNKVQTTVDGVEQYKNYVAYPLLTNGIFGAVIRIDDITEKSRLEDMMVQTEKMMSIGGLAAGMAHEINNPLSSIIQGVQNIRRRLSPDQVKNKKIADKHNIDLITLEKYLKEREITDFLNGILDSGIRASEIVKNMLNFSRRSESKHVSCSITDLLDETVELASHDYDFKRKYDFKKINIIKEYQPDVHSISCVKSEIQQVILNLLKNGAEIMSEKTQSAQEPDYQPTFYIRIYEKEKAVYIEVEDNGPGMDKETTKKVFEPFFTTKPVGVGTGLGLSVSFFIITQNHKGNMWVESDKGKGAKFVIQLPANIDVDQA